MSTPYEIVLAFVHADREWAFDLVERLAALEVVTHLDEWTAADGRVTHGLEEAARRGRSGVVVLSRTMLSAAFAAELDRVLLDGALAGGRRIVPVLRDGVTTLPVLLENRPWVEFRAPGNAALESALFRLVQLLKGERPDLLPRVDGGPAERGGAHLAPARPRRRLVLRAEEMALYGGASVALAALPDHEALPAFPEAVGRELEAALSRVEVGEAPLELAIETEDPALAGLEWEAATLGDVKLAFDARVELVRCPPPRSCAPRPAARSSFGVLIAVATEADLARALDVVEPALTLPVTVLSTANGCSAQAIRAALDADRPAVLVLSCEVTDDGVVLEGRDGATERLHARALAEALGFSAGRVPLLVLVPCLHGAPQVGITRASLEKLSCTFVQYGLPAVLALDGRDPSQASSGADAVVARALLALARNPGSSVVEAVAWARRGGVSGAHVAPGWEQAVLTIGGVRSTPWVLPSSRSAEETNPAHRRAPPPGRRAVWARMLRTLRQFDRAGVVVRGGPGTGASLLANRVVDALRDDGWIPVRLAGPLAPDEILSALSERILDRLDAEGRDSDDPMRQAARWLARADCCWSERIERLESEALKRLPVVVLLDGFDWNLDSEGRLDNAPLGHFLEAWLADPARTRVVIVSSREIRGMPRASARLADEVLTGLGGSETRLMIAQLDALRLEPRALLERLSREVAGLPRALRLADAHVRSGGSLAALVEALEHRVSEDRTPARALAVAIAKMLSGLQPLAPSLLAASAVYRLPVDRVGLAWQVSALRSDPSDPERDRRMSKLDRAIRTLRARGEEPTVEGLGLDAERVRMHERDIVARLVPPLEIPDGLDDAIETLRALDLLEEVPVHEGQAPRYRIPGAHALSQGSSGEAVRGAEDQARHERAAGYYLWRVAVLPRAAELDLPDLLEARHHLASSDHLDCALEVTGCIAHELDGLGAFRREEELLCSTLSWTTEHSRERAALEQQLGILAQRRASSSGALAHLTRSLDIDRALGDRSGVARSEAQLGVLAQLSGDLPEAKRRLVEALAGAEAVEDEELLARVHHQLGIQAELEGELDEAAVRLLKTLERREALGDPAGSALTQEVLGRVECGRGRVTEGEERLRRALALLEVLGDEAGCTRVLMELGDVALAQGALEDAMESHRAALVLAEGRGDPATISVVCLEIGRVALAGDDLEDALEWARRALSLAEEDGTRAGIAACYQQLAVIAERRGHPRDALRWSVQAVGAYLTIEAPGAGTALRTLSRLARVVGGRRWQDAWSQAHAGAPPSDLVVAVESAWWQRLVRVAGADSRNPSPH